MNNVEFNNVINLSEKLNNQLAKCVEDVLERAINACASEYKFNAEEAIRFLGLKTMRIVNKSETKKEKVIKEKKAKQAFPLPFNGEFNDTYCYALRQNNGLYTQCQVERKGDKPFCKNCQILADKNANGKPDYGTIQDRLAVGIYEYVDPSGKKPVAYTKVMKKYNLNQEQVIEEAGKFNININDLHFNFQEESKRGRPKTAEEKQEKKSDGKKGRPKKTKKVIEVEDDQDDLFATLVANANASTIEDDNTSELTEPYYETKSSDEKSSKNEEEKAEKEAKKAADKAEKEAKKAAEKAEKEAEKETNKAAEKEAKKAAEKAEKEAKKAAEKAEKEAKVAAEKAEKEAKVAAEKAEKEAKKAAEKEAKKAAEKAEKEAKKASEKEAKKPSPKTEEKKEVQEAEVVKKFEFQGKKYLRSKSSGIVYDYDAYVNKNEQIVIGKWIEVSKSVEFQKEEESDEESDEEEEEEYDE